VDISRIFGQFEEHNKQSVNKAVKDLWEDKPQHRLRTFAKLIRNHNVFLEKTIQYFSHNNPDFDEQEFRESGDLVVYNRAFYYIKDLDLDKKEDEIALAVCGREIQPELYDALMFFEDEEEYEKCAIIHKFIIFLKEEKISL
jgi:hypothetical protein